MSSPLYWKWMWSTSSSPALHTMRQNRSEELCTPQALATDLHARVVPLHVSEGGSLWTAAAGEAGSNLSPSCLPQLLSEVRALLLP